MKMDKHLRIRITEEQMNRLVQVLKKENKQKSTLLRELIDHYLDRSCREYKKDK